VFVAPGVSVGLVTGVSVAAGEATGVGVAVTVGVGVQGTAGAKKTISSRKLPAAGCPPAEEPATKATRVVVCPAGTV
jgi:hypothetical protein